MISARCMDTSGYSAGRLGWNLDYRVHHARVASTQSELQDKQALGLGGAHHPFVRRNENRVVFNSSSLDCFVAREAVCCPTFQKRASFPQSNAADIDEKCPQAL